MKACSEEPGPMTKREFDIVLWGGNWCHRPPHRAPSGKTL